MVKAFRPVGTLCATEKTHNAQHVMEDEGNVAANMIERGQSEIPINAVIEQMDESGVSDVITFVITHPGLSS